MAGITKEEFADKLKQIQPYDFIFVHVKQDKAGFGDVPSVLTQIGTGYFCHVEVKLPTIEYKGKQMDNLVCCAGGSIVGPEALDKYLVDYKKYQLFIMGLRNVNNVDKEYMEIEMKRQMKLGRKMKTKYDWDGVAFLGLKGGLTKIWGIGSLLAPLIWTLPNPHDPNKLFCTESSAKVGRAPRILFEDEAGNLRAGKAKYDLPVTVPPTQLGKREEFEIKMVIG